MSWLDRDRTIAPPGFNRWLIPPAALAVHLCIGQVYATSVYKTALVEYFDASLTQIGVIFSIAIVMLGLSAAVLGTWVDRNGPRKAMFVAAVFWAGGFFVGSVGIFTGQLWLLYLGYGFIGGIGLGIGYISPVSTLMKWFPDRPGLATGMAIMGFGGGALVASPLSSALLGFFDPESGTEGWVASGDAVGKLFLTLGLVYLVYMLYGAWSIRVPAADWKPAGFDPSKVKAKAMVTTNHVSAANAIKTKQFWLVWVVLFCNVTAGIGILEQAAPMIQDFFRQPDGVSLVSAAVAGGFVGLLSIGNMGGRFVWSATSDLVGRKRIYMVYLGLGGALYILLSLFGGGSTFLYVALAFIIISFYGGGFATVPAYLRDLFGTYQVGAIHGRLLTAWSAAGIAGPLIVNSFLDSQGTPGELTAAAYQPALLTMVGLLVVGFIANLLVTPVASRYHEPKSSPVAPEQTATVNGER
ncbi:MULTISPECIES: OFA family MFS transporter [unclassified Arthrobacter]|uniref:OFA family MFS transporter n=1 Tax=unclassified Arthrobacter TaxID=235627 RepID=UPI001E50E7DF|nr:MULTISPECIES: OFA family MFS transporter [unclassified Arthrobacter]MCC9144603.1 OFA family MFS transporter [Arthrobacter sp. zg-Y919]MDK1275829.1 OFA family MFS transporter [Arthrobacter sp. zg.Y919]WIB02808.1 OFA family MFS transporter [Arthrobacter sp. zg-Y919]